jgi:AcrR family transcriptional regulator
LTEVKQGTISRFPDCKQDEQHVADLLEREQRWSIEKQMGRPREFDVDHALDTATQLFWRKGYDATSLADLTQAIGISPPSFYAAFQSKEALFHRIVQRYSTAQTDVIGRALAKSSPVEIVRTLMDGIATLFTAPGLVPGCLIMNSALPVTGGVPFRNVFARQREELRRRLRNRLAEVSAKNEFASPPLNAATISRLVLSVYWGMAIEAQSGASRKEVRAIGTALVRLLESHSKS